MIPNSHAVIAEMEAAGWAFWHDFSDINREMAVHYAAFHNATDTLECGVKYAAREDYDEAVKLAALRAKGLEP